MRIANSLVLALAIAVAAACTDSPTELLRPAAAAFGKGNGNGNGGGPSDGDSGGGGKSECGGTTALPDSRAILDWSADDAVSGDGSDVFTGDQAGVHAKIFYHDGGCSRSGDIVFDADMNSRRNKRHLTFHFPENRPAEVGQTVTAAPFIAFPRAMQLGSDIGSDGAVNGWDANIYEKNATAPRGMEHPSPAATYPGHLRMADPTWVFHFPLGINGCEVLRYDAVAITRESAPSGFEELTGTIEFSEQTYQLGQWSEVQHLGRWTVRSVATSRDDRSGHWATCWTSTGSGEIENGEAMDMPFTVEITEDRSQL